MTQVGSITPVLTQALPLPRPIKGQPLPSVRLALPGDAVCFSGTTAQQPPVMVAEGVSVSERFRRQAQRATTRMLKRWPANVRQALLQNGFQVVLVNRQSDGLKRLEELLPPSKIFYLMQEVSQRSDFMPQLMAELARVNGTKDYKFLVEEVTERIALKHLAPTLNQSCALLAENPPVIRLAETIDGPYQAAWEKRRYDVDALTEILHHESGHFIDVVLGMKKTGRLFSRDSRFKERVDNDIRQTRQVQPALLNTETENWTGATLGSYLPISQSDPDIYGETFAESAVAGYGKGAFDPAVIQAVLQAETLPYVKDTILKSL